MAENQSNYRISQPTPENDDGYGTFDEIDKKSFDIYESISHIEDNENGHKLKLLKKICCVGQTSKIYQCELNGLKNYAAKVRLLDSKNDVFYD